MKIAVVTGEYWPFVGGGCGISTGLLVSQLRKSGHIVDVYVYNKKNKSTFAPEGSVKYFKTANKNIWPLVNLQVILTLKMILKRYDIVHVYSTIRLPAMGFLRALIKTPIVTTLNGEEAACLYFKHWMECKCSQCTSSSIVYCAFKRSKEIESMTIPAPILAIYFIIHKKLAKKLDSYFALSNVVKELYISSGFSKEKITIIPNMYDPQFLKALSSTLVEKYEKIVVLYTGRLTKDKGVHDLVKAFMLLKSDNAELWIVGSGPEESNLTQQINGDKNIRMLGFIDPHKIHEVYKKAHVFVHPGRWPEPFGRTILEAMLAKLAIIVSDIGAPPSILSDAGLIYKTGNISELSSKLQTLINNEKTRLDLGMKAYSKAIKDYSPDTVTLLITSEYERLTKNKDK